MPARSLLPASSVGTSERHVDDVALARDRRRSAVKRDARAVRGEQLRQVRLEHRQLALARAGRQDRHRDRSTPSRSPSRPPPRPKRGPDASCRRSRCGGSALIGSPSAIASSPSRRSSSLSHRSVPRSVCAPLGHQLLEVRVFGLPGRVVLHQRHRAPPAAGRWAARACARVKVVGPHLHSERDVRAAVLGEHVAGEVVAPRRAASSPARASAAPRREPITTWSGARFSKRCAEHDAEVLAEIAEPEPRRIEQVRAEIGQHARAVIAPGGIAHQPRRAVAVEHAAVIDRARARRWRSRSRMRT